MQKKFPDFCYLSKTIFKRVFISYFKEGQRLEIYQTFNIYIKWKIFVEKSFLRFPSVIYLGSALQKINILRET